MSPARSTGTLSQRVLKTSARQPAANLRSDWKKSVEIALLSPSPGREMRRACVFTKADPDCRIKKGKKRKTCSTLYHGVLLLTMTSSASFVSSRFFPLGEI
jgi:hypothetical protein